LALAAATLPQARAHFPQHYWRDLCLNSKLPYQHFLFPQHSFPPSSNWKLLQIVIAHHLRIAGLHSCSTSELHAFVLTVRCGLAHYQV
jgi:hypothetical protein